jgi:hypothetical protein
VRVLVARRGRDESRHWLGFHKSRAVARLWVNFFEAIVVVPVVVVYVVVAVVAVRLGNSD